MKIAIIGSRTFDNYQLLHDIITSKLDVNTISCVVSGGANGADILAEKFAQIYNIKTEIFKPEWSKYGRSAGYRRNIDIINAADVVFAFIIDESKGSMHSVNIAKKQNKRLIHIDISSITNTYTIR